MKRFGGPGSAGLALLLGSVFGIATPALATGLTYTCAASIDATQAGTCAYLNSTISGLYGSAFTNANANIYIQQGITGLGSSTVGFYNDVSYATYLSDLTGHASGDAVDLAALTALNNLDTSVYGSGKVVITSALGLALGLAPSSLTGTTAGGAACAIGSVGCYNGIITITTPANLSAETGGTQSLYYRQTGGAQASSAYDFYTVVEHETDEIFGTSSCISTQGSSLSNPCNFFGSGTPSAVDLFRYSSAGNLVLDSSLSTTPGAYFSYDGGVTNGAAGAFYNTLSNDEDYADFASNCKHVQDAEGCLGTGFDISNDGNAEIHMLDAVGYNASVAATPEPGTWGMLGSGLMAFGAIAWRRRKQSAGR